MKAFLARTLAARLFVALGVALAMVTALGLALATGDPDPLGLAFVLAGVTFVILPEQARFYAPFFTRKDK